MDLTKTVADVLVPRILRIPDYQRGYSWQREHVQDFLDDLRLLEDGQRHYTGTLVLLGSTSPVVDDHFNALAMADVVDGQQRLTTVALLIDALSRAIAASGDEQAATGLHRQFLATSKGGAPLLKLQVQSDAKDVWQSLIGGKPIDVPTTVAGKRLLDASRQIREHVDALVAAEGPDAARALSEKVITKLQFTLYELDSQAEVGVVFETLNDRGKPLTELEKVKNYLLFLAARLEEKQREALAQRINDAWSSIYHLLLEVAAVSSAGEDQFLRAHWLATEDPVPVRWRGTKSVKERYARERYLAHPDLLIEEVGAYVGSLRRAARSYADSLRPDVQAFAEFGALAAKARTIHARLSRAGTVAAFQPLMIAMREVAPTRGDAYVEALELCLRYAVRTYLIAGYRADAGQTRLYRLANDLVTEHIQVDGVAEALRRLVHDYGSDDVVRKRLLDTDGNWYRWGGLSFFLYEYETSLLKGAKFDVDYAYFENAKREKTVEHVLPQTASSPYWTSRFDASQRDRLTHALGNLVLTLDNSSYSNKDFPLKRGAAGPGEPHRACYAQAPLRQEQELASLDDWGPSEILDRQQRLAEWALSWWAVDVPHFGSAETVQDEEGDDVEDVGPPSDAAVLVIDEA